MNVGCIPKKLLVYAAHYGDDLHDAAGYGWSAGGQFNWSTLIANKNKEIERLNEVYRKLLNDAGVTIIEAHVSLWASLPHYLSVSPNPRGTLALLLRLNQWLGLRVDTTPLERAAADFQAKINDAVNADPKLSAFVRELKKREFEQ